MPTTWRTTGGGIALLVLIAVLVLAILKVGVPGQTIAPSWLELVLFGALALARLV